MNHLLRMIVLTTSLILVLTIMKSLFSATHSDRFVWMFGWDLGRDQDVAEMREVLVSASKSGYSGAVLSAGLDSLCKKPPEYFRRLHEIQAICKENGLELIPSVFSIGYGGGILTHNRNLAEGLPVEGALFEVRSGEARIVADPPVQVVNGGFEEHDGKQFKGFNLQDLPGVVSFVDTKVVHGGKASLRMENFTANPTGNGRVAQQIRVKPHRCYRMSLWVKTEDLKPAGGIRLFPLVGGDRDLAPRTYPMPATSDWKQITTIFNSLEFDAISLYAGIWEGKAGRYWFDDWVIEELGPRNVLRRPGTPVTVRNENGTATYVEGIDYASLQDPDLSPFRVTGDAPPLRVLPNSKIRNGQRLRVSWYHPMLIHDSQVTTCMVEPEIYKIMEEEVGLLIRHLHPERVLLNMDEVRMGGTCKACEGKDMAALVGESVTKQMQMLRAASPGVEVYVWSDMFDPNHNAHGNYYLVKGDYTGSWNHVPKDIIMAVWGGEPREKSVQFFTGQGFRMLISCYYDASSLDDVKGWMKLARDKQNVRGFMYTTWEKKYSLVPAFGKLVSKGE